MDAAGGAVTATALGARPRQTGGPGEDHDKRYGHRGPSRARGLGAPRPLTPRPLGPQAVVGDSEYHHFRYRIPPARVRLLEVGGDLQLQSVKIF